MHIFLEHSKNHRVLCLGRINLTRSIFYLFFGQLEGIEICFLTTVAWHRGFVFTVKPKRIRTHCTNSSEQTVPAPKIYLPSRRDKTAAFQRYRWGKEEQSVLLKVTQESVAGQGFVPKVSAHLGTGRNHETRACAKSGRDF